MNKYRHKLHAKIIVALKRSVPAVMVFVFVVTVCAGTANATATRSAEGTASEAAARSVAGAANEANAGSAAGTGNVAATGSALKSEKYKKEPKMIAEAAILIDANTGNVLYEKNADVRREPASTTKIMTALLAIENLNPDDEVKVTRKAYEVEGSSVGIIPGEKIKADDLIYGTLLLSGNDAATALAIGIDGSVGEFANRMNNRVKEMGLTHTHFMNPHGLHDADHYTTARDLAVITFEAMKNEAFRKYVSTYQYIMPKTNKSPKRYLNNSNRLLYENNLEVKVYGKNVAIKYPGVTGIKTGFTDEAGNCLVSGISRDGMELISIVLGSQGLAEYSDTIGLFEYGLRNFKEVTFNKKGEIFIEKNAIDGSPHINMVFAEDLVATINKYHESHYDVQYDITIPYTDDGLVAAIAKGDKLGSAWVQNKTTHEILSMVDLVSDETIESGAVAATYGDMSGTSSKEGAGTGMFSLIAFFNDTASSLLLIIILAVLAAIAVVIIVIITIVVRRNRKNRMYGAKLKDSVDLREVRRIKDINGRKRS